MALKSAMAGTKRKQSSVTPEAPQVPAAFETVDLTSHDEHHTPPRPSTPAKRQRLATENPTEEALSPTVTKATEATDTVTGLLSPDGTPQKPTAPLASASNPVASDLAAALLTQAQVSYVGSTATADPDAGKTTSICDADTTAPDSTATTKAIEKSTHSPAASESDSDTVIISASPAPPSATADPALAHPELYAAPELAPQYIPRSSTLDKVEYSNPQKFSIKPPYWKRWTPPHYARFADHLRAQFNPTLFAQEYDIPIDEVQHVFWSLVCKPLYEAGEASKRGEEGMVAIIEMANKGGAQFRHWCGATDPNDKTKSILGELAGVEKGKVILTSSAGNKRVLRLDDLGDDDIAYLRKTLDKNDAGVLWEGTGMIATEVTQEMEMRQWTLRETRKNATGKVAGVKAGMVGLRLQNGKEASVAVDKFIHEDQEYLEKTLEAKYIKVLWPHRQ